MLICWPLNELIVAFMLQFWSNVRTAFADQPDFVDLAEKLSRKFESLYENEVCISPFLFQKQQPHTPSPFPPQPTNLLKDESSTKAKEIQTV